MAERDVSIESLERALADVRHEVTHLVPPPPLAETVREAKNRTRRRWVVASMAAAAAAIFAVVVLFPHDEPHSLGPATPTQSVTTSLNSPSASGFLSPHDVDRSLGDFTGGNWATAAAIPGILSRAETCKVPLAGAVQRNLVRAGRAPQAVVSEVAILPDEAAAAAAQQTAQRASSTCARARPLLNLRPLRVATDAGVATAVSLQGGGADGAVFTEYVVVARSGNAVSVVSFRLFAQDAAPRTTLRAFVTSLVDRLAQADR